MRKFLTLQTQLIAAMVACVIVTVAIALSTATVLMNAQDLEFRASLSDKALAVKEDISASRVPEDLAAMRELLKTQQRIYGDAQIIDSRVLLGVAISSVGFGGLLGIILARFVSRPLGDVSAAAKRVAAGDLSARAHPAGATTGETFELVENFNLMADALERFQRQSVESSAAIAHELRTPLAILRGRLQGMQEGLFGTGKPDIQGLIEQVDSLARIVSDLNTVSLAAAGQLNIVPTQINLMTEINSLLDFIEPDFNENSLSVERDLKPVFVNGDAVRLRQATLVLLENARQHAAAGQTIRVETVRAGNSAIIRVLDRGPGLPADSVTRIFEPFYRLDSSRSRQSGGSGLGLSVVAGIARAHQGNAAAKARHGGGAIFEIELPVTEDFARLNRTSI